MIMVVLKRDDMGGLLVFVTYAKCKMQSSIWDGGLLTPYV